MENFKNEIVIPAHIEMKIKGNENWINTLHADNILQEVIEIMYKQERGKQ